MRFIFRDLNQAVIDSLRNAFTGVSSAVAFEVGELFGNPTSLVVPDWVVSPANSFGFMDGGVDDAIRRHFPEVEGRVQDTIRTVYDGELPVGHAALVATGARQIGHRFSITHCVVAPTMRSPQRIHGTCNVYQAFRATILLAKHDEELMSREHTLLCPGMGTATGALRPEVAALQMRAAYRHAMTPPRYRSVGAARAADDALRFGIGDYC